MLRIRSILNQNHIRILYLASEELIRVQVYVRHKMKEFLNKKLDNKNNLFCLYFDKCVIKISPSFSLNWKLFNLIFLSKMCLFKVTP